MIQFTINLTDPAGFPITLTRVGPSQWRLGLAMLPASTLQAAMSATRQLGCVPAPLEFTHA